MQKLGMQIRPSRSRFSSSLKSCLERCRLGSRKSERSRTRKKRKRDKRRAKEADKTPPVAKSRKCPSPGPQVTMMKKQHPAGPSQRPPRPPAVQPMLPPAATLPPAPVPPPQCMVLAVSSACSRSVSIPNLPRRQPPSMRRCGHGCQFAGSDSQCLRCQ